MRTIICVGAKPGESIETTIKRAMDLWSRNYNSIVVVFCHNEKYIVFGCPEDILTIKRLA